MKVPLRIIGDVHGRFDSYGKLCDGAEYTLQVGDICWFDRRYPFIGLDADHHKVIAGNHDICEDNHPRSIRKDSHFLDDYGTWTVPEIGDIFYMRGAVSIDQERVNEQMSDDDLEWALELYKAVKPSIVVSHQCPSFLSGIVGSKETLRSYGFTSEPLCRTGCVMRRMFEEHEPKLWVFGHYHKRWSGYIGATKFVCLDMIRNTIAESCYLDLDTEFLSGLQLPF